jgi:hypothetical protein
LFDLLHVSLPKQVDPGQHGCPSDPHASQVPLEQKAWLPWHCAWPWMLQQAVPTCPHTQEPPLQSRPDWHALPLLQHGSFWPPHWHEPLTQAPEVHLLPAQHVSLIPPHAVQRSSLQVKLLPHAGGLPFVQLPEASTVASSCVHAPALPSATTASHTACSVNGRVLQQEVSAEHGLGGPQHGSSAPPHASQLAPVQVAPVWQPTKLLASLPVQQA